MPSGMDLSLVMLGKGILLALVGAATVAWGLAVEREKANLTFRKDRKGRYRAFAPLSAIDGWWSRWKWWLAGVFILSCWGVTAWGFGLL